MFDKFGRVARSEDPSFSDLVVSGLMIGIPVRLIIFIMGW